MEVRRQYSERMKAPNYSFRVLPLPVLMKAVPFLIPVETHFLPEDHVP